MGKKTIIIMTTIILIVVGINFIYYNYYDESKIGNVIPKERALLNTQIYDWAMNLDNEKEVISQYWIYNYGNVQANDIEVKCILYDGDYNILNSNVESIGNLASNSVEYKEMIYLNNGLKEDEMSSSICFVKSCDDCEILWENIPELKKEYL